MQVTDKKGRVIIPPLKHIKVSELQTGDILLFYYGNKLTSFHGRNRRKEFGRSVNPPYHAALVYMGGSQDAIILDPVEITKLQSISKYMQQSTKQINVIRYNLTPEQKNKVMTSIQELVKKPKIYDVRGYFAFLSQMPYMGWCKFIKPSETKFYCSDAVTYVLEDEAGVDVSPRDNNFTAPVDLELYALENPSCNMYTLKIKG